MLTWYQSKVKYGQVVDGKTKTVAEQYLHEAVNFGEVELQCYERLKTRIKYPDVDAIAKATFGEVVFYGGTRDDSFVADPFYRIGIETSGEKSTYLIPAVDAEQAMERALKAHGYGEPRNIFEVKRTDILAVWHPNNELWQGDWWNRMELLKELRKHSWDINQENLFNHDGSAKTPTDEAPTSTAPAPDFVMPEVDEATRIAQELALRKTTTPALQNTGLSSAMDTVAVDAEDLDNGSDLEQQIYEARFIPDTGPALLDEGRDDQDKPKPTKKGKSFKGKLTFHKKNGEPVDG